jgi:hypothetical protein
VKVLPIMVGLILLACASLTFAQETEDENFHPTDADLKQMEQSCFVADAGMVTLQERLNAALADWAKATTADGPLSAMKKLDGYFEQVRNQGAQSGKKGIYLLCVEKSMKQFVEARRARPQAVNATGNSQPLQLSAFSSEEEIWRSGCKQAEVDAMAKLKDRCGDRTFVQTNSDCAQMAGAVRTYSSQVSGECRLK